jgi:hypothetical protein
MESQVLYGPKTDNALVAFTPTEDVTYYVPFLVNEDTTFDRIVAFTGGGFVGTASVRLGVYNNANNLPTTVRFDAGTVSCTASNTNYLIQ